ncbi:MAG TPA: site-specific DNA-methyltransferase [Acidimicrobiales bacterium]|nr:site-specific DNA-methyltransferase [Acidimicrobiales bacterium]
MSVVSLSAAKESRKRRSTATANFGSGRREGHDASAFYDRFVAPEVSADTTINRTSKVDVIYTHDARHMDAVASNSVALVVTSPPYFAGKQYEEILGVGGVPANYFEYLDLLHDVFAECKRVLEPGGRIAVNVANLGRRPYRSLSGDVTEILQRLGLLMRGEVIWLKGKAAGGSCAWGTFQRPSNPVLRDVTERIVIASKGRFDRALKPEQRLANGLPSTATISRDEFVEATTDLWEIAPESATKVGHPAPFPVELPQRLIELYTYQGDVVLDPFMGSGSAALAAVRTGRHFIGFDTDKSYVAAARRRVTEEQARLSAPTSPLTASAFRVELLAVASRDSSNDAHAQAVRDGLQAKELAGIVLSSCGFADIRPDVKPRGLGIGLTFVATDQTGGEWAFDVSGAFTTNRAGLRRADTLWKSLGKAAVLHESRAAMPLILLTTDAPARGTAGHKALDVMRGPGHPIVDVIELLNADDQHRLREYAQHGAPSPIG